MKHVISRRRRGRKGKVTYDFPEFIVELPTSKELVKTAAKDQATTLKKRLSRLGGRYRGLARASIGSVSQHNGEVALKNRPDNSVARMDDDLHLTSVNEGTLESTLRRIIEKAM